MIKIFDSTDTSFSTNGNIVIKPLKQNEVKKKSLNGWYVDIEVSIKYKDYIQQDKLCVVKTKSKLRPQAFRIKDIEYTQRKIIFTAEHVMFDARNYFLLDVRPTNLNGLNTLKYINERTDNHSPFNIVSSDIKKLDTCYFIRKNLLEAWATIEERYNGIFDADNFDISFNSTIGIDRGETIVYGKNMQNIRIFEDWSNVCTRIYPVGKDGLMLASKFIDGKIQYDRPYTKTVSFGTSLDDEDQTQDNLLNELKNNANNYLQQNMLPLVSYEITSDINQQMEIGDKIHVKHPLVNILTEVLEYEYNGITKKVKRIVFGNYTRDVKAKFDNIKNSVENLKAELDVQSQVISEQTDLINSLNKNGYVYIDDNEILILDKLPIEEAKNVWRFGLGGIGFSSNGYKGPFNIAMTSDGKINADFITTGILATDRIEGYSQLLLTVSNLNNNYEREFNFQKSVSGSSIHIEDASDNKMVDFEIDGKSEQSTRSGKNLFNYEDVAFKSNGITVDKDGWITITCDNTNGTATKYLNYYTNPSSLLKPSTNYIIFVEIKDVSGTGYLYSVSSNSNTPSQFSSFVSSDLSKLNAGDTKAEIRTTLSDFANSQYMLRTYCTFNVGESGSITFRISVLEDTSTTVNNFVYEPYGVMPSPDYPSEIKSVGYENLFDINTATLNSALKWSDGTYYDENLSVASDFIKIEKGKSYISKYKMQIILFNENKEYIGYYNNTTGQQYNGFTISTDSECNYVKVSFRSSINNNVDFTTIGDIQLEKGLETHSYITYGKYGIEVKNTGKNLFDENKYFSMLSTDNGIYTGNSSLPYNTYGSSKGGLGLIFKPNTSYTISFVAKNTSLEDTTFGVAIRYTDNTTKVLIVSSTNWKTYKIVTDETKSISMIFLTYYNDSEFSIKEFMLSKTSDYTGYEPYRESTSLFILDQPLRSLPNGVKDTAYIKNNILYVDRKIGRIVLNGSENWGFQTLSNNRNNLYLNISNITNAVNNSNNPILSNRFNYYQNGALSENYSCNISNSGYLNLRYQEFDNVNDFKTWLSTNNVEVQYELAEPYTEEIGKIEMPSTFKGANNISTTDELEPIMNLTYLTDTLLNAQYATRGELSITSKEIRQSVSEVSSSLDETKSNINIVQDTLTSQSRTIEIISKNIDSTTGNITEVTTTNGFTFNSNGLKIYIDENSYNTVIDNVGTYYKDGDEVINQTTKDGSMLTNLSEKGQTKYSYNNSDYDFIDERIEVDGEYAYATFYNGED